METTARRGLPDFSSGIVRLVSPEGGEPRRGEPHRGLQFRLFQDGSRLFPMQRSPGRSRKLATADVRTLREIGATLLNIPPDSTVAGFSLHPDGKRFTIAVGTAKRDIWLMQGFDSRN